jgi:hypothetical protein
MGNRQSTWVVQGAKGHSKQERELNDYYATDPKSFEIFLDRIKADGIELPQTIHEPACGAGHLVKVLRDRGYEVFADDLIDRCCPNSGIGKDFLQAQWRSECIITNPPYSLVNEFAVQALKLSFRYVIFYVKLSFLETTKRYQEIYKSNPPKYVYIHSARQNCKKNALPGERNFGSSAVCYCWVVWEKYFMGDPVIRWL